MEQVNNIDLRKFNKLVEDVALIKSILLSQKNEFELENEQSLESELRPEYAKKLMQIDKQKGIPFKDIDDLRRQIEG